MSTAANKALMSTFLEFINTANVELGANIIAKDAVFHVPFQQEPLRGPEGYLMIINMMRSGFSNIQWEIQNLVAEDDQVAAQFEMKGTHDGVFFGVPASGKPIAVRAMNFYRFADGQIIQEFGQPDMLGLMQQIGAIPGR